MNKRMLAFLLLTTPMTFVSINAEGAAVVKAQPTLVQAAIDFDADAVRALLDEQTKADINRVDDAGNNPLMAAFASGKACDDPQCKDKKALSEIVTLFINKGIDLTTRNSDDKTALEIAQANGYTEASQLIANAAQA